MFRVENNVPEVYPSESRDFQLFSRLYDLVFQASRYSIESMSNISCTDCCNDRLLPLLSTKVGFFSSRNISDTTFRRLLSAFPIIMRYKGSRKGIELILNVFEKIANTNIYISPTSQDGADLTIIFSQYSADLELLEEMLEYIRPTGFTINYITSNVVTYFSDFIQEDDVKAHLIKPYKSSISKSATIDYCDTKYSNTIGHTQLVKIEEPKET